MSKIYLLSSLKFEGVENLEVFSIEYISSNIDIKKYDALIFTSKNAIYSLDSFNESWKNIPSYAIAPKTAEIIKKYGGNLVFTGKTSHGDEFAQELISFLKNKKALYVRAQKTVSNLCAILKKNNIQIDELITYKTSCNNTKKELDKDSTFIFTAPSTIECFFKNYQWDNSFKAIAIGKTTAKYFPENISYKISSQTSIEECIKLAQKH